MFRSRGWCFTLNNWTEEEYEEIKLNIQDSRYWVIGKEIGKKGTKHLQGYVYYDNARRFGSMKKKLLRSHIEKAKGSAQDNRKYCTKDNNFKELGIIPEQGKRTDLDELSKEIMEGRKVDDICIEQPMKYHQYGRTLNNLEDLRMRTEFRTEMTKGEWYYGKTGTGKSHKAFENFSPKTHYVLPEDNGWWDGYKQQDTVIINDFRGELPYNFLLQLIDKWPLNVKRRGREPIPFTSKKVIITSSLPPKKIFCRRVKKDKIKQLLRRLVITKFKKNGDTKVVGGNTKPRPTLKKNKNLDEFIISNKNIDKKEKLCQEKIIVEKPIAEENIQVEDEDIQSKKLFVKRSIKMQKKKQSMEQIQQASPVLERPYYKYHTQHKELELTKESEIK